MAAAKKKVNLRPKKVDSDLIESPSNENTKVTRKSIEERGAFPATVARVEEAAKMISKGKGRAEVIEYIQNKYGLEYDTARKYFVSACHFLIPDDQEGFRESLIKQNIERLEKIITDAMAAKNYKAAREAIDTLNKTLGVYGNGNAVVINKNNEGDEQIIVKFGG